jgi:NADPH:quinone reductase
LDAAEAVSVVLNYITAYQMLHRSAKVKPGQRVLFHGASGGVGTLCIPTILSVSTSILVAR